MARLQPLDCDDDGQRSGVYVEALCTGCGFSELIPVEWATQGEGLSIINEAGQLLAVCSGCSHPN